MLSYSELEHSLGEKESRGSKTSRAHMMISLHTKTSCSKSSVSILIHGCANETMACGTCLRIATIPLINSSRKALTAFEECDLTRLAQSSHSALRRRTNRYMRPAVDLIEDYLSTSRHFVVDAGTVRRPPSFEPERLNGIEEDAIKYLRENPDVSFALARDFLQGKGHSRENISFALTMSSLVFVDKTSGRGHYTYHTVEPIDPGQPGETFH